MDILPDGGLLVRLRLPPSERDKRAGRKPVNACVGNVSDSIRSRDPCRIVVHLLNDRAPFALHATQKSFCMSAAHERHPFFAFVGDNESRYRDNKKIEQENSETPWMTTQ
jgi:hypothetical protein